MPRPTKNQIQDVLGRTNEISNACHAEIQLLLHLESHVSPNDCPFSYIRCSKKPCGLCHQFLSRYKSRKTDRGKSLSQTNLPSLAHCTRRLPTHPILPVDHSQGYSKLDEGKLSSAPPIPRHTQAESSANVTAAGGSLARCALANRR